MEIFGTYLSAGNIFLIVLLAVAVAVGLAMRDRIAKRIHAMRQFFGEVAHEMTKVTWPTREEVVNNVVLVLVVVTILTVVLMTFDRIFGQIVGLLFVGGPSA